jgi:hypothetical protein
MWITTAVAAGPAGFRWEWRRARQPTRKVAEVRMPAKQRTALIAAIAEQFKTADEKSSGEQLREFSSNTRVMLVDINGDASPEVIAQPTGSDWCGAVGNCRTWIFQRKKQQYILLLDFIAQSITVQGPPTSFRDIVASMHSSAMESELRLFRYRTGRYRESGCYVAMWYEIAAGDYRRLAQPFISTCESRKDQ